MRNETALCEVSVVRRLLHYTGALWYLPGGHLRMAVHFRRLFDMKRTCALEES